MMEHPDQDRFLPGTHEGRSGGMEAGHLTRWEGNGYVDLWRIGSAPS